MGSGSSLEGENDMAKVIGIDLGTTNSCVSVMDGKDAKAAIWKLLYPAYRIPERLGELVLS